MGKNKKDKKLPKPKKTKEDRQKEANSMKEKIEGLGLSTEFPAVAEFYKVLDQFVEDGFPVQGKTKLIEFNREIAYVLTTKIGTESALALFNMK